MILARIAKNLLSQSTQAPESAKKKRRAIAHRLNKTHSIV